jgi:hypothetical protein
MLYDLPRMKWEKYKTYSEESNGVIQSSEHKTVNITPQYQVNSTRALYEFFSIQLLKCT